MGLIVNIAARRLAKADINPERCITMIFYATLHHHCALPDRAHKIQVNTTSSRNISDFIMRAFRLPAFLLFPETQRDTRFERSAERERESRGGDLRTRFHPRTRATDYASWDETSSLAVRLDALETAVCRWKRIVESGFIWGIGIVPKIVTLIKHVQKDMRIEK